MRGAYFLLAWLCTVHRIIPAHAGSISSTRGWRRWRWDHPRTCGEHDGTPAHNVSEPGSSPHMRGACQTRTAKTRTPGIIPAHAGSICRSSRRAPTAWDHPRTCGEHPDPLPQVGETWGSSPHMRGAFKDPAEGHVIKGDHPRTCGEHLKPLAGVVISPGSSPHMRGAPFRSSGTSCTSWIIPAHAGSTRPPSGIQTPASDHPRTCGEHAVDEVLASVLAGSSPHMRGAHGPTPDNLTGSRIIPAHAGSTTNADGEAVAIKDHPRTCGEHSFSLLASIATVGSSPHMRGALGASQIASNAVRIIPAHAGSTAIEQAEGYQYVGSSPHMRGAPDDVDVLGYAAGIIPAHAGSTERPYRSGVPRRDHPRTCGEHATSRRARPLESGSSPHMRGAHR